jgi:tRNA(fMet)-specific endonuclease VapC
MALRLMDTNIASFMLKGHSLATRYRRHLQGHQLAVSFMTVAELYEWAFLPSGAKRGSLASKPC